MLNRGQHIHILACGGIGMSALCLLLLKKGVKVTGSDANKTKLIEELIALGLHFMGENEPLEEKTEVLIYSSAIPEDHLQWQQAKARSLPCLHRAQGLNLLMSDKRQLLVAGTHGKTTTSSLLTHVLKQLGSSPSYAIGGTFSQKMAHADYDEGEYCVIEADESDGSFLTYQPYGMIVTNIDLDHMDYWGTQEKLEQGFYQFISGALDKKLVFLCKDDPILSSLGLISSTYGVAIESDFRLIFDEARISGREALVLDEDQVLYKMNLVLNGHHNVLNALGVFALVKRLGFEPLKVIEALSTFSGVDRRCQIKGMIGDVLWIDDYGHHPTEIKTTLKGIKQRYPDKTITVVFQPHRYTRTQDLWDQFYESFGPEHELIVTDIYGAYEKNIHHLKAEDLALRMAEQLGKPVIYKPRGQLKEHNFHHDLVVTFGAGDITTLYHELL